MFCSGGQNQGQRAANTAARGAIDSGAGGAINRFDTDQAVMDDRIIVLHDGMRICAPEALRRSQG